MPLPNRHWLRTGLTLAGCLVADLTPASITVGLGVLVLGAALHLWSKGCLRQNRELTLSGPYRWVRNPFYLAHLLVDLGLCVLIHRWWIAAVYLPLWWAVYARTMGREEVTLEQIFGESYRRYLSRVPRLLPLRRPLPRPENGPFFWWGNPNLVRGNEYARLVRVLSLPLLIYVCREIWTLGWSFPTDSHSLKWAALWLLLALKGLDRGLLLRLRDGRTLVPEVLRSLPARALFACGFGLALLFVTALETEIDHVVLPLGGLAAGAVLIGITATPRTRSSALLAWEAAAWLAAGWLAELPWLGVLGASYVGALALDSIDIGDRAVLAPPAGGWRKGWALGCSLALLAIGPAKELLENRSLAAASAPYAEDVRSGERLGAGATRPDQPRADSRSAPRSIAPI